jgi:UDP-N-acetyl-D-mannosaminuronic acid transferase (WecB/TagA/CpsF family)
MDPQAGRAVAAAASGGSRIRRVDVLGVGVSAIDMDRALHEVAGWVERRERHYVCVTGVHGVMESRRDAELRRIHNASGLTTPDGMPMVWAGRRSGAARMERVYGPDLMLALCELAAARSWSSYFLGGLLPQAPRWMQRSGLEWLYRLGREPRLARRYLRNNPHFLLKILRRPPRLLEGEAAGAG